MVRLLSFAFLAVLVLNTFAQEVAGPQITWNGLAQYRLRFDIDLTQDSLDNDLSRGVYSNRISFRLGAKIKANDQVSLQFELGNEFLSTDEVSHLPWNYFSGIRDTSSLPYFSLAYVNYNPGFMHILAGIVPVKTNAMMDLLGNSIISSYSSASPKDRSKISYDNAAQIPWGTITNMSLMGLKIGAPILSGDFKLGFDFLGTVLEQRGINPSTEFKMNSNALLFLAEMPIAVGGLTVLPQAIIIPSRLYSATLEKGDMEVLFGAEAGYKFSDGVSVRAGFGYATITNENTLADTTYFKNEIERNGFNSNIGGSVKLGPGKLDADYNFSVSQDKKIDESKKIFNFVDIRYTVGLTKNFVVVPRLRVFLTNSESDKVKPNSRYRPELMFIGSF